MPSFPTSPLVTDEYAHAELKRWVERHEGRLQEQDGRLDEIERRQDVLYTGLALARWIIAISIPTIAVAISIWRK